MEIVDDVYSWFGRPYRSPLFLLPEDMDTWRLPRAIAAPLTSYVRLFETVSHRMAPIDSFTWEQWRGGEMSDFFVAKAVNNSLFADAVMTATRAPADLRRLANIRGAQITNLIDKRVERLWPFTFIDKGGVVVGEPVERYADPDIREILVKPIRLQRAFLKQQISEKHLAYNDVEYLCKSGLAHDLTNLVTQTLALNLLKAFTDLGAARVLVASQEFQHAREFRDPANEANSTVYLDYVPLLNFLLSQVAGLSGGTFPPKDLEQRKKARAYFYGALGRDLPRLEPPPEMAEEFRVLVL